MKRLLFLLFLLFIEVSFGQISLTTIGSAYTQDFNTLANTGTSSTLPAGWSFVESGTNANTTYTAGTGSSSTGDTYSFGSTGNSERALGGLRSGSLNPIYGASFTNNTGSTINSINISYTGETWRVGTIDRSDRLDFQFSLNATSLTTGTWIDENSLDYINPGQAATGNGTLQHSSSINFTITGLSITNGSTFWLRWIDFDASGADDGMAIDDFSIIPNITASSITTGTITGAPFSVSCSSSAAGSISFTSTGTFNAGNTFTAQLSNSAGSFASPLNISTPLSLSGTSPSGTINFTIPSGITTGSNYAIRIVSSSPAVVSNTSSPITITLNGGPCTSPYITSILINACASAPCTEGDNEIIFGNTGDYSVLANASNLAITYGSSPAPSTSYTDAFTNMTGTTSAINAAAGCTIVQDGLNEVLPPNSSFLIARSSVCVNAFDWNSLCGLGPIYILYSTDSDWSTGGNFVNSGGGMRYLRSSISTTNGSSAVIDYNYNSNLFSGSDGEFVTYGPNGGDPIQYGDTDCRIEPIFLPTEIISFEAQKNDRSVNLYWVTQSEHNNDYFTVLHSKDGQVFNAISVINGAGNSNSTQNYSYTHSLVSQGINYYKLISTDFDGTVHFKGILSVNFTDGFCYFDPTTSTIHFPEQDDYSIFSAEGKVIKEVKQSDSALMQYSGLILVQKGTNGIIYRLFIP